MDEANLDTIRDEEGNLPAFPGGEFLQQRADEDIKRSIEIRLLRTDGQEAANKKNKETAKRKEGRGEKVGTHRGHYGCVSVPGAGDGRPPTRSSSTVRGAEA